VKDQTQVLLNGDTFSLLPDGELSYKVVRKSNTVSPASVVKKKQEAELPMEKTESEMVDGSRRDQIHKETHGLDDLLFGDLSPKAEDAGGRSPEAEKSERPSSHIETRKAAEKTLETLPTPSLSKPKSPTSNSPPKLIRASSSSTGRKRVLPSWLSSGTLGSTTNEATAGFSKKGVASSGPKKVTKRKGASASTKSLEDSAGDSLKASPSTPPPIKVGDDR